MPLGQVRMPVQHQRLQVAQAVFHRWRLMRKIRRFATPVSLAIHLASVPIICVAVDLSPEGERLAEILCGSLQRMLMAQPDAPIACVNILKTARIGIDQATDEANNKSVLTQVVAEAHCSVTVVRVPERCEGVAQA